MLANAVCQLLNALTDPPPSRASPLPHLNYVAAEIVFDAGARSLSANASTAPARAIAALHHNASSIPLACAAPVDPPAFASDTSNVNPNAPPICRLVDWQFMLEGKVQDVSVEGRLIFDIGDALVDGALGGFGIAQVMDFAVREDLAAGRLVPLLEDFAGRSRAISLVYPPSRQYSPKLMAFAEALSKTQW